jgi:hypothetical protein
LRRGRSSEDTCGHLQAFWHDRLVIAFFDFQQNSLAFRANRSDPCPDRAVITAKGENMITPSTEETGTAQATATGEKPKPTKKANAGARRAHVATKKGKAAKKSTFAKKAPKGAKKATGPRDGSKTSKVLDLLKRPGGATLKELMKATDWQPHSVRGFLSGTVRKKMGLAVTSTKGENGERSYSVKA